VPGAIGRAGGSAAMKRIRTMVDPQSAEINGFRARHLALARRQVDTGHGRHSVTVNEAESPLAWLARRKGRDGRPLIEPHQLQAGERLRSDFTRANVMPRMGTDWSAPVGRSGSGGSRGETFTETMIAARQRVHHALDAVGPEFSGLLFDVCCFLKSLADIERERGWPARSGKLILQFALDRLARHYGFKGEMRGRDHAAIRTWFEDRGDDGAGAELRP